MIIQSYPDKLQNALENPAHWTNAKALADTVLDLPVGDYLVVLDVPNDDYHAAPGDSSTGGKKALISEREYYRYMTEEQDHSGSHMQLGSATHDLLAFGVPKAREMYCYDVTLESGTRNTGKAQRRIIDGESFDDVVIPVKSTAGKIAKQLRDDNPNKILLAESDASLVAETTQQIGDRQWIDPDDWRQAVIMFDQIARDKRVAGMLSESTNKLAEPSVWHRISRTLIVKCRPDLWLVDKGILIDWKTIAGLVKKVRIYDRELYVTNQLRIACDRLGYGFSAAWYLRICHADVFVLGFVDKSSHEFYPAIIDDERLSLELEAVSASLTTIESTRTKTANFSTQPERGALSRFIDADDFYAIPES